MRFLVLVTDAFGGHGGIARFNQNLLTALCSHPQCAEVVCVPRLQPNAIDSLPAKLSFIRSGLNSKIRYLMACIRLVLQNPRFEFLVCGHINLVPVACLLRLWVKAPAYLVMHGTDAWQSTGHRLKDHLVRNMAGFISVSEVTKQRFLRWSKVDPSRCFILPNAVELNEFVPGPVNQVLVDRYQLSGKKVIMTLGRLDTRERWKGIDEILELLPELSNEIPNLAYLIAGDGTDRLRLAEKAKKLGVSHRTIFTGIVPEAEKVDHYRLADAYVMPGCAEGFGIAYLEALACGIPVVGSTLDGSREALRNGELGILVNPRKREELRAAILEALQARKGRVQPGLEYFSSDNFRARTHAIVDSVAENAWKK